MIQFDGTGLDINSVLIAVLDGGHVTLLDPGEELGDVAVMVCEEMPIARLKQMTGDQFEVQDLACYAPAHGAHPRHAEIVAMLAKFNDPQNARITCPLCAGTGWLPAGRSEAKSCAAFAVSMGVFRGVQLPETEALAEIREVAMQRAFSHVFDNPYVTRIMAEVESRQNSADEAE